MIQQIYRLNTVQNVLAARRAHRVTFLLAQVKIEPDARILDVGCGRDGRSLEQYLPESFQIVGIDLNPPDEVTIRHPNFTYYQQDARDLSRFGADEFDLTFSIGMMEHICDPDALAQMASEIRRVSKQWIIVVPWRYAWIEPHFKLPFFQLFPYRVQCALAKAWDLNSERENVQRDPDYLRNTYEWLSTREWKRIFFSDKAVLLPTLETIAIVKTL